MATTIRTIITRALRRIDVIAADATPTATEADNGLDTFNDMMAAFKAMGADISHTDQALDDNFALDAQYRAGIIAQLAARYASEYGGTVDPQLAAEAAEGERQILANYSTADLMEVDRGLLRMPSQGSASTGSGNVV